MRVHVDRMDELARFKDCLEGRGSPHIMLIRAEAGMGKTALLGEFLTKADPHARALIDFKSGTYTVPRVLCELCGALGAHRFFEFFNKQGQVLGLQLTSNKIVKSSLDIDVHLHAGLPDADQIELRRQVLTHAFFTELIQTNPGREPTVVVFDAFERASPEVKDWLTGSFLTFARAHRWLVAVVAGQTSPEPCIGWDDSCCRQTLQRLDPTHVSEWVNQIRLPLSPEEVAFLHETTDGIPLDVSIQLGRLMVKRGVQHAYR